MLLSHPLGQVDRIINNQYRVVYALAYLVTGQEKLKSRRFWNWDAAKHKKRRIHIDRGLAVIIH